MGKNAALAENLEAYVEFCNRTGNIECETPQCATKLEADTQPLFYQMVESFHIPYEALTDTFDAAHIYQRAAEDRECSGGQGAVPLPTLILRSLPAVENEIELIHCAGAETPR